MFGTFFHSLVLFIFGNKISLDFYFTHVLVFLFHDLNLKLSMFLFLFWLENLVVLVVFVPMTLPTQQTMKFDKNN